MHFLKTDLTKHTKPFLTIPLKGELDWWAVAGLAKAARYSQVHSSLAGQPKNTIITAGQRDYLRAARKPSTRTKVPYPTINNTRWAQVKVGRFHDSRFRSASFCLGFMLICTRRHFDVLNRSMQPHPHNYIMLFEWRARMMLINNANQ